MDRIRKFRLVSVRDADLDRTLLQTCPVAWRQLGCCYETGRGVGQDLEKAAILYSQAAVEGDEVAQYNLGQLYFHGRGVKKRHGEGSILVSRVCHGRLCICTKYAWQLLYNGWGIKKDWGMAVKFFRMAAEQGDTDGQINLRVCYQYGRRS